MRIATELQQMRQEKEYKEIKLMNEAIKHNNAILTDLKDEQKEVYHNELEDLKTDNSHLMDMIVENNKQLKAMAELVRQKDEFIKAKEDKTTNLNLMIYKIGIMNANFDKEKHKLTQDHAKKVYRLARTIEEVSRILTLL